MRREWIEMPELVKRSLTLSSLPPCGGSGLKYFVNKIMNAK